MLWRNGCYDKRRLFLDNSVDPTTGSWDRLQVLGPLNCSVTAVPRQLQTCSAWPDQDRLCTVITDEFDGLILTVCSICLVLISDGA